MEKYIFRGVRVDNNEMVYGYLLPDNYILTDYKVNIENEYCLPNDSLFSVIPETIGNFTGYRDKNGKKIYKGDIIKIANGLKYEVSQNSTGEWYIFGKHYMSLERIFELDTRKSILIVGNVYQNKELLNN